MSDYISREAALKELLDWCVITGYGGLTKTDVIRAMENVPAADVAPVVHGEWIDMQPPDADGNVQCWCSVCGAGELHAENQIVPYCWKCGAKMRPTSMSVTNGGADNAAD